MGGEQREAVLLGFVGDLVAEAHDSDGDVSVIGGEPRWIGGYSPDNTVLNCRKCGRPLVFLCQLSTPYDSCRRVLYLFECTSAEGCSRERTGWLALRASHSSTRQPKTLPLPAGAGGAGASETSSAASGSTADAVSGATSADPSSMCAAAGIPAAAGDATAPNRPVAATVAAPDLPAAAAAAAASNSSSAVAAAAPCRLSSAAASPVTVSYASAAAAGVCSAAAAEAPAPAPVAAVHRAAATAECPQQPPPAAADAPERQEEVDASAVASVITAAQGESRVSRHSSSSSVGEEGPNFQKTPSGCEEQKTDFQDVFSSPNTNTDLSTTATGCETDTDWMQFSSIHQRNNENFSFGRPAAARLSCASPLQLKLSEGSSSFTSASSPPPSFPVLSSCSSSSSSSSAAPPLSALVNNVVSPGVGEYFGDEERATAASGAGDWLTAAFCLDVEAGNNPAKARESESKAGTAAAPVAAADAAADAEVFPRQQQGQQQQQQKQRSRRSAKRADTYQRQRMQQNHETSYALESLKAGGGSSRSRTLHSADVARKADGKTECQKVASFYIDVDAEPADESVSQKRLEERALALWKSYTSREEDGTLSEEEASDRTFTGGGACETEHYEVSPYKTLLKFQQRLSRCPRQVIRYCFGGQPLWLHAPSAKARSIPLCERCGGERVFEMQLMPTLPYELQQKLRLAGEQSSWTVEGPSWGTVVVFTCAADCTGSDFYVEEHVVVQEEA